MQRTILVIDDNKVNLSFISTRLKAERYDVIEGFDGAQAVRLTMAKRPDLIILDIGIAKMSAFTVCRILKKNKATEDIPIILMTSKGDIGDKLKGFDLGVDDYMIKPINSRELLTRVSALLKKRAHNKRYLEEEKIKAMDRVVEGVAHEVRNPVVSIGGFARRIYNDTPENDPRKRYARIILKETKRLENMVMELCEFKIISSKRRSKEEAASLLDASLWETKEALETKKIKVTRYYSPKLPKMNVNRKNMILALSNIISNAIEAMDIGGILSLRSTRMEDNHVALEIEDNGRGVANEDLDRIFEPFFTTKVSGAGMGLNLVRKIIKDHNGTITIRSKQGKSTTVLIQLPGVNDEKQEGGGKP